MSKSIAPGVPIGRQGIPFAASSATIRETHRTKKALPMRLPISSMLRNPQKQSSLQRREKIGRAVCVSVTKGLPNAQEIYAFAAKSNLIQVNRTGKKAVKGRDIRLGIAIDAACKSPKLHCIVGIGV